MIEFVEMLFKNQVLYFDWVLLTAA